MKKIFIPISKINFDQQEQEAVAKVFKSGHLTNGQKTDEFEQHFARYVGSKYAVFVNSCTLALFLSLKWHKLMNRVIGVPSFTFAATAHEVINTGNKIKWLDINRETGCIEGNYDYPIITVHFGGNKSRAKGTITIEDSAHLIAKNQCRGNENLVCFSFFPNKNMTTGEGGMIATNNAKCYEWLKKARLHGIIKTKHNFKQGWGYEVEFVGWKANPTDIAAAIGLVQLAKLPSMDKRRQEIVKYYNQEFGRKWSGLHIYPLLITKKSLFINKMLDRGIQCSFHFLPLHRTPAYKRSNFKKLPNTEWLFNHSATIPLYSGLTDSQVEYVSKSARLTKLLLS